MTADKFMPSLTSTLLPRRVQPCPIPTPSTQLGLELRPVCPTWPLMLLFPSGKPSFPNKLFGAVELGSPPPPVLHLDFLQFDHIPSHGPRADTPSQHTFPIPVAPTPAWKLFCPFPTPPCLLQLLGDVAAFLEGSVPFSCCQSFLCRFLSSFLAGPFAQEQKAPPGFSPCGGAERGILISVPGASFGRKEGCDERPACILF